VGGANLEKYCFKSRYGCFCIYGKLIWTPGNIPEAFLKL
jgi:hypothetical protein